MSSERPKLLSLAILESVKTAQAQNGLRHADFSRYRAYCARRLRRLRTAKRVQLTCGKGTAYVSRPVTADNATDVRHLLLIVFSAERSWAASRVAKLAAKASADTSSRAGGASGNALRLRRARVRARAAAAAAASLVEIARAVADARTVLEAEAYAAWLSGESAVESEDWSRALADLGRATSVYTELERVSSRRDRELFAERLSDVESLARHARYQQIRAGGVSSVAAARAAAAASSASSGGGVAGAGAAAVAHGLGATVAAARADAAAATADGVTVVAWRGVLLPVRGERVRAALTALTEAAARQSLGRGVVGAAARAAAEAAYIDFISRADEAARVSEGDGERAAREGRGAAAVDARGIAAYARFLKLRASLERHVAAAMSAAAAADAAFLERPRVATTSVSGVSSAAGSNAWAGSPLHDALRGGAAAPAGAAALANTAVALFARAAAAAGDLENFATSGDAAERAAGVLERGEGGGGGGSGGGGGASESASDAALSLRSDQSLACALAARREGLLAARAVYVSAHLLWCARAGDAVVVLTRAAERAAAARAAIAALPDAPQLPPGGGPVGGGGIALSAGWPSVAVLSGISGDDIAGLDAVDARIARLRVRADALSLLASLRPRLRADSSVSRLWAAISPQRPLVRAARAVPLAQSAHSMSLASSVLEPSEVLAAALAGPRESAAANTAHLPVPFRPILIDTVFGAVSDYPVSELAKAAGYVAPQPRGKTAAGSSATPAAGASTLDNVTGAVGGALSWLVGGGK